MHNFGDILQYVLDFEREQLKRHFGSDYSAWRGGDWNGFVRIALAGLLAPLIELARSVISTDRRSLRKAKSLEW